jgi:integrase
MAPKPTTAERRATLLRTRPDVAAWFKDHGKIATATTQLDQLEIFLRRTGLDVRALVESAKKDPRKLKTVVGEYVRTEQAAGRKAKYILNVWWGVRSFLASVEAAPEWNPKVEKTEADEEDMARTVPTHDQFRQIASAVKSGRDRAVVFLLASSGVRIGVLATQFEPPDGLRLRHLPDLRLAQELTFEKVPFAVRVPAHLSKGKNAYYTFGSHEAADAVLAMLKERQHGGETLTPESPLILPDTRGRSSERHAKDGAAFMVRKALAERVKLAMGRVSPPGSRWSAHTFRAWFSTQMESCESRGLISRTRREFFMGHSLGVDGDYNVERPLSPAKLDELRASYARCEADLSTSPVARVTPIEEIQREAAVLLLTGFKGKTETEARKLVEGKSGPELADLLKSSVKPRERAVAVEGVPRLLSDGWEFISTLNGSMAVLRAPPSASGVLFESAAGPAGMG